MSSASISLSPSLLSAVDCGTPGSPDNGRAIYTNTSYLSVVRYECREGYNLAGRDVRQCRVDGSWDHVVPRCQKIGKLVPYNETRTNYYDRILHLQLL